MTAGPVRNRTAIANEATEFPHAIILGCRAINKPVHMQTKQLNPPFLSKRVQELKKNQKNHPQFTFTLSSCENAFPF